MSGKLETRRAERNESGKLDEEDRKAKMGRRKLLILGWSRRSIIQSNDKQNSRASLATECHNTGPWPHPMGLCNIEPSYTSHATDSTGNASLMAVGTSSQTLCPSRARFIQLYWWLLNSSIEVYPVLLSSRAHHGRGLYTCISMVTDAPDVALLPDGCFYAPERSIRAAKQPGLAL